MGNRLRRFRQLAIVIGAVLLIAVGALFGAARALLPLAADYREELEAFIGDAIDTPVQIGEMDVGWHGWRPELRLRDVALIDSAGDREPIKLQEVWVGLQLGHALFAGELQLADIQLEGVQIILQREVDGSISVRGLRGGDSNSSSQPGDGAANALGFLLLARRLDLVNASVVLSDAGRGIEYFFPTADIRVENDGYRHRAYALLELPKALGERIEVNIDFTGDPQKPKDWQGRAHLLGRSLRVAEFLENLPDQLVSVSGGVADLALWSQWGKGRMQSAFATIGVADYSFVGKSETDTQQSLWTLDRAGAEIQWQRLDAGWDLAVSNLSIKREGQTWESNDIRIHAAESAGEQRLTGGASVISVAPVVELLAAAMQGKPGVDWLDTLRALNPRGELRNLQFEFQPSVGVESLKLAADFQQVGYTTYEQIPGVAGLTGNYRSVGTNLEVDLFASELVADVVPLFREKIQLQALNGRVRLSLQDDHIRVSSDRLEIKNPDLSGRVRFSIHKKPDSPVFMDMQANFNDGNGSNTGPYLPVGIMPKPLIQWLDGAIVGGQVERGSMLFRGALSSFPFSRHNGVFNVDFYVRNAQIDYMPQWPVARGVDARVQFLDKSLTVVADRGEVAGSRIDALVGHVESLFTPVVQLEGNMRSAVGPLLTFAKEGPLSELFYAVLEPVSGEGDAGLAVRVRLPLDGTDNNIEVGGGVTLRNANLYHAGMDTDFTAVNGTVQFDQQSINASNVRARALGADLRIDAEPVTGNDGQPNTQVTINTTASAATILNKLEIPIATYVVGESAWAATLTVSPPRSRSEAGRTELRVRSDLQGTQIKLPTPLYKPADQKSEFALAVQIAGPDPLKNWEFSYGDVGSAKITSGDGFRVGVSLGRDAAEFPATDGFEIRGHTAALDVDNWRVLLDQLGQYYAETSDGPFDQRILAQLSVDHLAVNNKLVSDVALVVDSSEKTWRLGVDSDMVRGTVTLKRPFDPEASMEVQLAHLNYDKLEASTIDSNAAASTILPADMPPFTFTSNELVWRTYLFKNVRINARSTSRGLVLDPISVDNEALKMRGNGLWAYYPDEQRHHSSLTLEFSSDSLQDTLADLRQDDLIAEGNGYIDMELYWPDAIYQPSSDSIAGEVKIVLKSGRILTIDPGAGRLLGLLALNQLPRRLRLDFKDALRGGLEFDEISGGLFIGKGVATTDLVRVRGPVGVIDIAGSADFIEETYDQRVVVLPRVGASLPLLGVLSGGLGAGLAIFISDSVLKNLGINLDNIGRREYTLTGSWENPVIEDVTPRPNTISNVEKER